MKLSKSPEKFDKLTGLYKAEFSVELLRHAVKEVDVLRTINPSQLIFSKGSVGIIFMDVYKLKIPHDNYGHPPIDEAISNIGHIIQSFAQETDFACRYGGDEFLLIMPGVSIEEMNRRAEQVRHAAAQIRVVADGEPREHIILSIGVAHYPTIYQHGFNSKLNGAEALMRVADDELQIDRARNAENQI